MKILHTIMLFITGSALYSQAPLQYVNTLIGTAPATTESARKHSEAGSELRGQTFPAVGRPFGMTQWTPETRITELNAFPLIIIMINILQDSGEATG